MRLTLTLLACLMAWPALADDTAVVSGVAAASWCAGWNAAASTSAARADRYGKVLRLSDDRTEAGQVVRIIAAQLPLLVTVEPIGGVVRYGEQVIDCR